MRVVIDVMLEQGSPRPRPGAPLYVEIRDTGLADAPSVTLARGKGTVQRAGGEKLATVTVELPSEPRHATAWGHVDVDRDGRVSRGDLVTTAAYPLPSAAPKRMRISLREVR